MPLGDAHAIGDVLGERKRLLLAAVEQSQPDVLLVEHFPISKWVLHEEILAVIAAAQGNHGAKVVCSLARHLAATPLRYRGRESTRRTKKLLESYFDRLLVHADPQFVNLDDTAEWTKGLTTPIDYTGFVSAKSRICEQTDRNGSNSIIVSMGGAGDTTLARQAIAAWKLIETRRDDDRRMLVIFLPLSVTEQEILQLHQQMDGHRIRLKPFAVDFLEHLGRADLSLSHGGYNTTMNLLATRTRAAHRPNSNHGRSIAARRFA